METKKAKKPLAPRVDMPCQPAEVRRTGVFSSDHPDFMLDQRMIHNFYF